MPTAVTPTVRAVGAIANGAGAISPGLPAGTVAGDLLVMFLETGNEAITVSGWTEVPTVSPQSVASPATRLTVFYKIAVGGDATTTSDSGDHQIGRIVGITAGTYDWATPIDSSAGGVRDPASTTATIPGPTTTEANCLVLAASSHDLDQAGAAFTTASWANANLTSITERINNSATDGNGGGLGVASGLKATAGAVGNTTVTVTSSVGGMIAIAIRPGEMQNDRVSQVVVEAFYEPIPAGRVSQLPVEVLIGPAIVALGDTAVTITDSISVAFSLTLADTGATIADSISIPVTVSVTDTATTITDSISLALVRTVSDTGATVTDSISVQVFRTISDTGATISDSIARTALHPRTVSDTGATVTDSISRTVSRSLADTAATVSDATVVRVTRALSDTAVTITDTIDSAGGVQLVDTGATVTDSLVSLRARAPSDTGATVTDSLSERSVRTLADTAATVTDSIASGRVRALADTGVTASDALSRGAGRTLVDTGATVTDSLASRCLRTLSDTGATIVDTPLAGRFRAVTDTGATITDSLAIRCSRTLTDAGVVLTDSAAVSIARQRLITDTALTLTDTLDAAIPGVTSRSISDTALTISDSIQPYRIRALADTGSTITDLIRRFIPRTITDTAVTMSELLVTNDFIQNKVVISGSSGSVSGATSGATVSPGEYQPGGDTSLKYTVWFSWTAPADGKTRFQVTPTSLGNKDPWLAVYRHDSGAVYPTLASLVIWNNDPTWSDEADFDKAVVNFIAEAGVTYDIQVGDDWSGAPRGYAFDLTWQPITLDPPADDFPGVTLVNNVIVDGNPEWATNEPGDPWEWVRSLVTLPDYEFEYEWPDFSPSNRTMIYKFTPTVTGDVIITFFEIDTVGSETGESTAILFDGAGVSSIADLTPANMIAKQAYIYGGEVFSFAGVAGHDYYLWVAAGDVGYYPDARHRLKVRWPIGGVPPNDEFDGVIDLDDLIWHVNQTTENATWEELPDPGNDLDNLPEETPEPATVWYRMSFDKDPGATVLELRNMDFDAVVEYYEPRRRTDEYLRTLVDTAATITDGVTVDPREHWDVSDTAVTFSEALSFKVARSMVDTGATVTDAITKPPTDNAFLNFGDTISKKVTRKMTDDSFGPFFGGVANNEYVQKGPTYYGRPLTDTAATISDSIAVT